jgi:hypothetical protein
MALSLIKRVEVDKKKLNQQLSKRRNSWQSECDCAEGMRNAQDGEWSIDAFESRKVEGEEKWSLSYATAKTKQPIDTKQDRGEWGAKTDGGRHAI